MTPSTYRIHQNILEVDMPPLGVTLINEQELNLNIDYLKTLIDRNDGHAIGLAGGYSPNGRLVTLALADASEVLIIQFFSSKPGKQPNRARATDGRKFLEENVLCRSVGYTYAFDMAPLALALWNDHNIRITNARDIQAAGTPKSRVPFATIQFAVGDRHAVYERTIADIFGDTTWDDSKRSTAVTLAPFAQRSWIAHYISQIDTMEDRFYRIPSINTQKLTPELLNFLGKSSNDSYQRDQMKSTQTTYQLNDRASWDSTQQQLQTKADRFQNRLRRGANQHVRINVGSSNHGFTVGGRVDNTHGRSAHLATAGNLDNKTVTSVTVVGRDDPTSAESQRALALLHILQGTVNLEDNNPWVQWIWLQPPGFAWPWANEVKTPIIRFDPSQFPRPLNQSQISAVEHMLQQTDPTRITLIQGPPGTGKTTVIASYIQAALQGGRTGIWLLAQSNVAVKNIAEKLALFGLFNWKLLVSQDFYVDWHEHLYTDIKSNIIQSQEFSTPGFLSRELHDCPVILCTLSMIFSPILQRQSVFRYAPLKAVVIDEASQIEIGDYIPMFTSHKSIRKICFIGDDKQLPPYGQDNNEALQSIFEVEHLRTQVLLLNTQYRMPPQIGDFISQAIYEKQLGSNPEHPVTTDNMACHFINVSLGYEEPSGKSYKNTGECKAILKFAAHLETLNKMYRIITPYEGQRSTIEDAMKDAELSWEDKCFNVDSFQGNEEDYIIISLVRSEGLGFLTDLRRTNVMLTRCKRGMFIFTSKAFMESSGHASLVGSLLEYYDNIWVEVSELENIQF